MKPPATGDPGAPWDEKRFLRDLNAVGPKKPIGYLPLYTIRNFAKRRPKDVAAEAVARGLAVRRFGANACCIKSGALYVYHRAALQRLLDAHASDLLTAEMPLDSDGFVAYVAAVWLEPSDPGHSIIIEAFGETA